MSRGGGVQELVVGIPARNEAATIGELANAVELGCALLGECVRCEVVLAYQHGSDDTLERWQAHRFRIPNRVLYRPEGVTGKGRNVKLLIRYAQAAGANLLLVDADLGSYPPSNVAAFARPERLAHGGLVLPLWCRPKGQGNSTDFLACPLLFAGFGARIRQPLAGQMLLTKRLLGTLDAGGLPDDYGIDVALTMHALQRGLPVDQVVVPFPDHEGGGNSHQIMGDVARVLIPGLAAGAVIDRGDTSWPERWWDGLSDPPPSMRSLQSLIQELTPPDQLSPLTALLDCPPEAVRDFWCDHLAAAVHGARAGFPTARLLEELVPPFLLHAEYRRRVGADRDGAEAYVADLCDRLGATLS
jgi:glycosyltransferase involved in cell wall biosynthesis